MPVWQRQEVQAVLPAMTARRKNSGSGDGKPTSRASSGEDGHEWEFKARFRRHAFGWRSQPAIRRIKQAVTEITKVARKDPMLAAEGAIAFLERVSPAIEHVDGSSGSIGTAVNNAVAELVPIIAVAPADAQTRDTWLERLWEAYQADEMPYIESLGDYWGELCGSKEMASTWADRLIDTVKRAWSPDPSLRGFQRHHELPERARSYRVL